MLGDQLLIAPITKPMEQDISTLMVWLPEGSDWYEVATGTLLKGGQTDPLAFCQDRRSILLQKPISTMRMLHALHSAAAGLTQDGQAPDSSRP